MKEKIVIKLTIAGESDSMVIQTARWLQRNRHEAITAIGNSCRPEIVAYSAASNNDINQAKLEALAYYEYRANVLRTQLYATGQLLPPINTGTVAQLPIIDPIRINSNGSSTNGNSTLDLIDDL
jgi:hypothetical protein